MPDYTITLSPGYTHTLVQDVIYALPVTICNILAANLCQISPVTTTTAFFDVTATTTGLQTGAAFIRCTGGNTTVAVHKI